MKIAIFTDTFLPQVNGVTNTLKRFGDFLESVDIDYIFITPDQKGDENVPYNMETFFSTSFLFYPECRFTLPNMIRLNKKLDKFMPDIIFLMTEFTIGLSGLIYGKVHNIPVISNYSTNFGTILQSYNQGFLEKPLEKYLRWFHNEADFTVTPSRESQLVLEELGVTRTGIFGRGIDYESFSPANRSKGYRESLGIEDKLVLLYVGRLSAEKDLYLLRESIIQLNENYKDRIALIVTGEGPMLSELEKTMPDNVIFTGYKKGQELACIYASADIFAFPSSFETFGNVVLEAYASGTPVVGVAEGGVKCLVEHGVTGYLAEPRNSESFTFYLKKMIDNDIERHQFASRGRAFARSRSWNAVFYDLLENFAKVINDEAISHQIHEKIQEERSVDIA